MKYTFLVIFMASLIGCGVTFYTKQDLLKYCKECIKDGSSPHDQPHPYRCDFYVKCQPNLDGFIVHEMPCPEGLVFNNATRNCGPNVNCVRSCNTGDKFRHYRDCDKYYECENGIFSPDTKVKSCGNGHRFNESQQSCIVDPTCGNSNCPNTQQSCPDGYVCKCEKVKTCDKYRRTSENGDYQQLSNGIWYNMTCPKNLNFNLTTCACTDKIASLYTCPTDYKVHTDQDKYYVKKNNGDVLETCPSGHKFSIVDCNCHPSISSCFKIDISMVNGIKDAYNSYVENKNVVSSSAYSTFNGSAYLIIPQTSNNEFSKEFLFKIEFYLQKQQRGAAVAVVGNSRCETIGTFSISVEDALTSSPKVVIRIKTTDGKSFEMKRNVSFEKWISLKIKKTESAIDVNIDGTSEVKTLGRVATYHCALGIGNMTSMANFVGNMKNFYYSKCL